MKNKFGKLFSIKQPFDIKTIEDTSAESLTQKILVVMRDNIDNAIVGEIVKTATAEGVTDLAILNKTEILKALEKQIPKKPSWVDSVPHSRCPVCHNAVAVYIDSPKLPYCHWCGQALDWGNTK